MDGRECEGRYGRGGEEVRVLVGMREKGRKGENIVG